MLLASHARCCLRTFLAYSPNSAHPVPAFLLPRVRSFKPASIRAKHHVLISLCASSRLPGVQWRSAERRQHAGQGRRSEGIGTTGTCNEDVARVQGARIYRAARPARLPPRLLIGMGVHPRYTVQRRAQVARPRKTICTNEARRWWSFLVVTCEQSHLHGHRARQRERSLHGSSRHHRYRERNDKVGATNRDVSTVARQMNTVNLHAPIAYTSS